MNRLIRIRLIVALALLAGLSAIGIGAAPVDLPVKVAASPAAVTVSAIQPIPVLPTVYVSAHAPITVLPLVIVRPSAAERLAAFEAQAAQQASNTGGVGSEAVALLAPHARLDMPYYSFGTMMPRASKD